MSNYEQQIMQILLNSHFKFTREKTFEDLKKGKFRYDFWLDDWNTIIEVNGQQHYEQVPHFHHTRAQFLKAQEHDREKISYALANSYVVYCIPFWDIDAGNVRNISDIFCPEYRAIDRWHNDKVWKERTEKEPKR